MSFNDFNNWMMSKQTLNVKIMDQSQVIAEVKESKVILGVERNSNKYPVEFTVYNGKTTINIGDRYINQIIQSGEYWCVFVDGHEHYLFS